jgi:hypothetical protein
MFFVDLLFNVQLMSVLVKTVKDVRGTSGGGIFIIPWRQSFELLTPWQVQSHTYYYIRSY